MPPRILHLSTHDTNGGAARAAVALHEAMLGQGVESRLHTGSGPRFLAASTLDRQLWRLQKSPTITWRSPARFGSLRAEHINRSSADVVNLHWVTNGFMSVKEIGRITKPVVWSLYDMWPFAGTEHYGTDAPDARWRTGYTKANRPADESGVDLDRLTWEAKRRDWARPMHIVPASSWLTDSVRGSALMGSWPIHRVPHVVDSAAFSPMRSGDARAQLGLPADVPLILFLASAGIHDARKGFDLLEQALPAVRQVHPDVAVVVVGPVAAAYESPSATRIIWQGPVQGDAALRLLYCAADVTAVPSREDNMPLTAMEATTCGRPVVGFDIGGLPDIVCHQETGFLAAPFDTAQLAVGLSQAVSDSLHEQSWSRQARDHAVATWSGQAIVPQYLDVYAAAMRDRV